MRMVSTLLAAALLVALVDTARAGDGQCGDRTAPVVLRARSGTLVVCGSMPVLDPAGSLGSKVTIRGDEDLKELGVRLSELSGSQIVIDPRAETKAVGFELEEVALWRALAGLTSVAHVRLAGLDYAVLVSIRTGFRTGEVSGAFHEARLGDVLATLSNLTAREITARPADQEKTVSLEFANVTLRELLGMLANESRAHIALRARRDAVVEEE